MILSITELHQLKKKFKDIGLSEARTKHLYVTYMMRNRPLVHRINPRNLAMLFRECPFLLGSTKTGYRGVVPEFDTVFNAERS